VEISPCDAVVGFGIGIRIDIIGTHIGEKKTRQRSLGLWFQQSQRCCCCYY